MIDLNDCFYAGGVALVGGGIALINASAAIVTVGLLIMLPAVIGWFRS